MRSNTYCKAEAFMGFDALLADCIHTSDRGKGSTVTRVDSEW